MKTKVIFFKQHSNNGSFSCANGEIESVVNARLIPVTTTADDSATDPDSYVSPAELINPGEALEQLNHLSSRLLPIVEFSLKPDTVAGWHNHPDNSPSTVVDAPKNKDADGWGSRAAYTLDKLMKDADKQHLFVEPFFALCALRLTDGSHILPSSPVLLIPNATAPTVEGSDNFDLDSMSMTIPLKACRLRCRLTLPEGLTEWSNHNTTSEIRVAAIDIFISSPIPLYHHNEPLLPVHRASGSTLPQSWLPTVLTDDEFTSHLLSVSTFRMVSTIPLVSADFFDVDFNVPTLPELKTLSAYIPDFLQHQGINAATGCRISGHTTLCNLTLTLPLVPPLATMMESKESTDALQSQLTAVAAEMEVSSQLTAVATEMEVCKNGVTLHSSRYNPTHPKVILSESDFPKWLFVPDADARQLTLVTSSVTFVVPLRRHPLLNGSYYWSGTLGYTELTSTGVKIFATTLPTQLHTSSNSENSISNSENSVRDTYRLPNAIWRSKKDCDVYFPDRLLMHLDVGRVIAVCRAFRASGLVATTAPTAYLFTTHGIYLLKEMNNGELRDAGLIANNVLDTPDSITVSGRTLYFTTVSGKRMVISGTTIKPVSTPDTTNLPYLTSSSNITTVSGTPSNVIITPIDPDLPIEVVTRPLKLEGLIPTATSDLPAKIIFSKLSNPSLFFPMPIQLLEEVQKLLWSIELRGAFTQEPNNSESLQITDENLKITYESLKISNESLKISLYGSTDLLRWKLLATSKGSILRGLYTPGLRYARLVISGNLNGSLEALSLHL